MAKQSVQGSPNDGQTTPPEELELVPVPLPLLVPVPVPLLVPVPLPLLVPVPVVDMDVPVDSDPELVVFDPDELVPPAPPSRPSLPDVSANSIDRPQLIAKTTIEVTTPQRIRFFIAS